MSARVPRNHGPVGDIYVLDRVGSWVDHGHLRSSSRQGHGLTEDTWNRGPDGVSGSVVGVDGQVTGPWYGSGV